jgi:large subunit ribosomal protein L4
MEFSVLDKNGKDTGRKVELNDSVVAISPNEHAIYLDVKQYLANQRQGTHKAKERAEIARTTKKGFKQKGTGNARMGSFKSPLHRGGGTVFGPRPHDYGFKLNKKVKRLARRSAISLKASTQSLMVLENLEFSAPKTKEFTRIIAALGLENKKSLIVVDETSKNVYLSSRNFQGSEVIMVSELSTYKLMNAQNLVFTEGSVEKINEALS